MECNVTETLYPTPSVQAIPAREKLPNRRASESFQFEHGGVRYTASVSFFDGQRLGEIFIDALKPGSAIAEHAQDAAVLASLLLQHGVTAATIKHSISGPLATALKIASEPAP